MKKLPLVVVEWNDTTSASKWVDEKDADLDSACVFSVGWRLKSPRKYVLLTPQRDIVYNQCADRIKIPKGCIRSIRKIE